MRVANRCHRSPEGSRGNGDCKQMPLNQSQFLNRFNPAAQAMQTYSLRTFCDQKIKIRKAKLLKHFGGSRSPLYGPGERFRNILIPLVLRMPGHGHQLLSAHAGWPCDRRFYVTNSHSIQIESGPF